jgi:hypothetical protein
MKATILDTQNIFLTVGPITLNVFRVRERSQTLKIVGAFNPNYEACFLKNLKANVYNLENTGD